MIPHLKHRCRYYSHTLRWWLIRKLLGKDIKSQLVREALDWYSKNWTLNDTMKWFYCPVVGSLYDDTPILKKVTVNYAENKFLFSGRVITEPIPFTSFHKDPKEDK